MGKRDGLPESAVLVLSPAGAIVEQRSETLLSNELLGEDVNGRDRPARHSSTL
ncbi:MAG: hypothetical protein MZV70_43925 [Desulfobacterales bacterium]|nr:hypothetical protein [Desulfobacterales bacterium]